MMTQINIKITKKYISNCSCSDIINLKVQQDCNKNEKYYVLLTKNTKNHNLAENNFAISPHYISNCELRVCDVIIDKYYDVYNEMFDVFCNSKYKLNDTQIFYLNRFSMNELSIDHDIKFVVEFSDIKEILVYGKSFDISTIKHYDINFDLYLVCIELDEKIATCINYHKNNVLVYNNYKNICEREFLNLNISKKIKHNIKATKKLYKKLDEAINKNKKIEALSYKITLCEKEKIYLDCLDIMLFDIKLNLANTTYKSLDYYNNKGYLNDIHIKKIYCDMNCDETINYDITHKIF